MYAPEDLCPCNAPDPSRGNGYVQLKIDFPPNENENIYRIFKHEQRNKMQEGRFLTERDVNALIAFVTERNNNPSSNNPSEPDFNPFTKQDYIVPPVGPGSYGSLAAVIFCPSLGNSGSWSQCTPELFKESWFEQRFIEGDSGETEFALECFTSAEDCTAELKLVCSS
jgi:hypothetical protein